MTRLPGGVARDPEKGRIGRDVTRWLRTPPEATVAGHDRESGLDDGGHYPPPRRFVWPLAEEIPDPFHHRHLSLSSKTPSRLAVLPRWSGEPRKTNLHRPLSCTA